MSKQLGFLKANKQAQHVIEKLAYAGQDPKMRMYKPGYEAYMEAMPVLDVTDPFLQEKVSLTDRIMKKLGAVLASCPWVTKEQQPESEGFNRTILAVEDTTNKTSYMPVEPDEDNQKHPEGAELVLARWGDGFSSPVHGHSAGYLHEEIIAGKMLVNLYRMITPVSNVVRLVKSFIVEKGTFASQYNPENPNHKFKRQALIHNFKSIGNSETLHYLPEHTRDGRDNTFEVQYFEDWFGLNANDVTQIDSLKGMYLQPGDVALVRSKNVPEYGDHYIVITGAAVVKPHGLRPRDEAIIAPNTKAFLDTFEEKTGLILLKFKHPAKEAFLEFHDIKVDLDDTVTFHDPASETYPSVSACLDNAHLETT